MEAAKLRCLDCRMYNTSCPIH